MLRVVPITRLSKINFDRQRKCPSWHRQWAMMMSSGPPAPAADDQINIGGITKQIKKPKNPELVPQNYVPYAADGSVLLCQTALHHLRWMLQKDLLRQDMFLLGLAGPLRRQLTMQFLELTQRELEYIALSRDTTESDLKQRREIRQTEAVYHDQSAVRAAIHGRVLVLDGVEHAERNVLPILNNLLENREMHLENGKFLMAPERYDQLLKKHTKDELDGWGLLRVSENFRVVALGLPTQRYKGTPLDPPFRSRFQSRNVTHFAYDEIISDISRIAAGVASHKLKDLVSFGLATHSADATMNLLDFPISNLHLVARMLDTNPSLSVYDALVRLYPYGSGFKKDQCDRIADLLKLLKIDAESTTSVKEIVTADDVVDPVDAETSTSPPRVHRFRIDDLQLQIPGGGQRLPMAVAPVGNFVDLQHQRDLLAIMMQSIAVGDICLIGGRGVGKSTLAHQLIHRLRQTVEPMFLYEDMTARDLVQQRITTAAGDTAWRDSPLVRAAKTGAVVLLNGVHRLHKSTITVLQRLVHDRELQLCDGSVLLGGERYDALLARGVTRLELTERRLHRIPDSFRIIATAEPPLSSGVTTTAHSWLTAEMLHLFLFVEVRPLQESEQAAILQTLHGTIDPRVRSVMRLSRVLRDSNDQMAQNLAGSLSTRQLLKIAKHLAVYPARDGAATSDDSYNTLCDIVENMFLMKFMPALARNVLSQAMQNVGIVRVRDAVAPAVGSTGIHSDGKTLRIGSTVMMLDAVTAEAAKIPSTLFYDVPQHVAVLERLLQDFMMGDHLLLVGNQGVGKNKLVDRLLQLMRRPREYLQLHRDTTVHSLTMQMALRDGQVLYEDSALVKAVQAGRVLVIDEADKAPVNVTCILRTLVESGTMLLADGRKIIPAIGRDVADGRHIPMHPDFRMIVLANRPGFPFLGNDFYAALGDVFTCHAIDNPSPASEIALLQRYAPTVPLATLQMLVNAFGELRSMADDGILNYPYSTREVVNIVRHLERFGDEPMDELVANVLDFDRYAPETLDQVTKVLAKHGLAVEAYARNELSALRKKREQLQVTVERRSGRDVSSPKIGKFDAKNAPHVGGNTWAGGTGGRDTAGLGGRGGPFRLDAGHNVHQLSDAEKADIPEAVRQAARQLNRKAFAEKLRAIQMGAGDHALYAQYSDPIRKQVQQLKAALDAMQTKSNERQWQKYQTHGDLDETRLIEGITGEKSIYRRRAAAHPWADHIQEKPNRFKLVVDVSGSMYRFNGYDGRLDRQLEAVVMVMESFAGYEKKIIYDIVGHSGEACEVPFVVAGRPPANDKERFETIRTMHAHAQFCWSGDNTLQATQQAIKTLSDEDYDHAIVVMLSDANLSRYGIPPRQLAAALMKGEPKVKGYAIFIGSLQEEATLINEQMPPGHSYVCMDVSALPQILKQIFTSSLL